MKFNLKAFSLTAGIVWALAIFVTGIANLVWNGYGNAFLQMVSSVYPGYNAQPSVGSILTGTCYAFVDGLLSGLVFGWIYNLIAGKLTG